MYSANAGTRSSANQFDRYTAHATKYSTRLRYMGLRVTRNTPRVTSDDVVPTLTGFIVVFARRKVAMAVKPKAMPISATTTATLVRTPNGTSTAPPSDETGHMSTPKRSATTGGGIFSSSEFMAAPSDQRVELTRRRK